MRRKLFTLAAAASAVLCAAVCVLWVRSHWYGDLSYHARQMSDWSLDSWRGHLTWTDSNDPDGTTVWWQARELTGSEQDSPAFRRSWPNRVGFLYRTEVYPRRLVSDSDWPPRQHPPVLHHRYVRAPHWLVAGLLAVTPAAWLRRARRRRRRLVGGLCPRCGYDLRATPDRCPECGVRRSEGE
jgi:hypothetical protein